MLVAVATEWWKFVQDDDQPRHFLSLAREVCKHAQPIAEAVQQGVGTERAGNFRLEAIQIESGGDTRRLIENVWVILGSFLEQRGLPDSAPSIYHEQGGPGEREFLEEAGELLGAPYEH